MRSISVLSVGILFASCGGDSTAPAEAHGIRIISGANLTDTVVATLPQPLVIEVRDQTGKLAPVGTVVHFTGMPKAQGSGTEATVSPPGTSVFGQFADAVTDATGRASALVRLGTTAGQARVAVAAPGLELSDTARFTVMPGQAFKVAIAPTDTFVYVGTTYSLRGGVVDQFGNVRSDQVSWSTSGAATVSSTGAFTSGGIGRFSTTATAAVGTSTATVSVVPRGRLAAWEISPTRNILLIDFNGDNPKTLATVADGGIGVHPAWMPDGSGVVYTTLIQGVETISITDTNGVARPFFQSPLPNVTHTADPSPTANGKWLYFSAQDPRCAAGVYCMYRSRIDGSAPELIGTAATASSNVHPSPSPDGSRVAFEIGDFGSGTIAVYDVATKTPLPWTTLGLLPAWSPDGTQIAFVKPDNGPIGLIKPDGTGLRTLSGTQVELKFGIANVNWTADSKYLVARTTAGGLFVVDVTTGATAPLPTKQTLLAASIR